MQASLGSYVLRRSGSCGSTVICVHVCEMKERRCENLVAILSPSLLTELGVCKGTILYIQALFFFNLGYVFLKTEFFLMVPELGYIYK